MTTVLLLLAVAGAASWAMTGAVRRYALARSILDVPNHRSSHAVATPRGGGVAIVVTVVAGTVLAEASGWVDRELAVALVGGGGLVAGVGWLDDRGHVPAGARAVVHFVAAVWAVASLGGLPAVQVGTVSVPLGTAGGVLAVLGVVWMINLFNFMDGIDGLAGGEALSVGLIGGALLWAAGERGLAVLAAWIAAASAGFLVWNWAPAKVFMGDVGSGSLGYFFAVLALASEQSMAVPLLGWVALAGVFVLDATVTLARRVVHGKRWYEAHRSHAYQRLTRAGWSHTRVSGAVLVVNGVLGVLVGVGWRWPALSGLTTLLATGLLAGLYLHVERIYPMWPRHPAGTRSSGPPRLDLH